MSSASAPLRKSPSGPKADVSVVEEQLPFYVAICPSGLPVNEAFMIAGFLGPATPNVYGVNMPADGIITSLRIDIRQPSDVPGDVTFQYTVDGVLEGPVLHIDGMAAAPVELPMEISVAKNQIVSIRIVAPEFTLAPLFGFTSLWKRTAP